MHDLDPVFESFSRTPELAALVDGLGMEEPLALQSMYIFKQPRIGGEVVFQQDSAFLFTDPPQRRRAVVCDRGCHYLQWMPVGAAGRPSGPGQIPLPARRGGRRRDRRLRPGPRFVPLEAAKETVVVLHRTLPHGSKTNRSAVSRHAYTLHLIDGACTYPVDNWLRRDPNLPLRGLR